MLARAKVNFLSSLHLKGFVVQAFRNDEVSGSIPLSSTNQFGGQLNFRDYSKETIEPHLDRACGQG